MERPAPDYPPIIDYTKPVERILWEDFRTGETAELILYHSTRRINQFRVTVNGREWRRNIGRSGIMAGIRKALWRKFQSSSS